MIVAIDPGPTESAILYFDPRAQLVVAATKCSNEQIRCSLPHYHAVPGDVLVIEQIAAMGMAVGEDVFETCYESGRFAELWARRGFPVHRLKRVPIKAHLCGSAKAKDSNVRQALIDRFGGQTCIRKGGALFGVHGDCWSALAVAVTWADLHPSDAA